MRTFGGGGGGGDAGKAKTDADYEENP